MRKFHKIAISILCLVLWAGLVLSAAFLFRHRYEEALEVIFWTSFTSSVVVFLVEVTDVLIQMLTNKNNTHIN